MSSIDAVRDFIVQELHWSGKPSDLTRDYPLIETHVLDSMGLLSLVSFLEEKFGVETAPEEFVPDNFGTLGKIAALIDNKRKVKEHTNDAGAS